MSDTGGLKMKSVEGLHHWYLPIVVLMVLGSVLLGGMPVFAGVATSGDVNGDGYANSTDALIVLSCDVGIDTTPFCPMNCGNVNSDGIVNSTDALIILNYDVGISVPFPVGTGACPASVTPCPGCAP